MGFNVKSIIILKRLVYEERSRNAQCTASVSASVVVYFIQVITHFGNDVCCIYSTIHTKIQIYARPKTGRVTNPAKTSHIFCTDPKIQSNGNRSTMSLFIHYDAT
jgi:hypothetical protein